MKRLAILLSALLWLQTAAPGAAASDGAPFVRLSPGATTAGCGVQYSDMPGVIGSCRG